MENVPFGIFKSIRVFGKPLAERPAVAPYHPVLSIERLEPAPPPGMEVEVRPEMVLYRGRKLSIGFSIYRPILLHLGWDAIAKGKADINRLLVNRNFARAAEGIVPLCGLSGPVLRTLDYDIGSHLWTGRLEIEDNQVRYLGVKAVDDLKLDAVFTIEPERILLEIKQHCDRPLATVEYEAWRLAFDIRVSPTGVAGVPSLNPGRNGHVPSPVYLAGEAVGCLEIRQENPTDGEPDDAYFQVESYRESEALTCGLVPFPRSVDGFGFGVPEGEYTARFEFAVTKPAASGCRGIQGGCFGGCKAPLGYNLFLLPSRVPGFLKQLRFS